MNSRNEAIRRVALWGTLLTSGLALASLLFGCERPSTILSAPGFPHASRQSGPVEPAAAATTPAWGNTSLPLLAATTQAKLDIRWIQPRNLEKPSLQGLPSGRPLAGEPGKVAAEQHPQASPAKAKSMATAATELSD